MSLLDPGGRSLLTDALRAPSGYRFNEALVTTYSLDLATLLTIPLHLAFASDASRDELLNDPVALMEALRRHASRLTVFAHHGAMHVPTVQNVLFGMLEPVVVQVEPPATGVFHAKLWVIRFESHETAAEPVIRLVVASRNLTDDRSWDVALTLDGAPGGRKKNENAPLAALLRAMPGFVVPGIALDETARLRTERFADACHRTQWELPPGFDSIRFHAIGPSLPRFEMPSCDRLAVLSPFIDEAALKMLSGVCGTKPEILISRPESLNAVSPRALATFLNCFVLCEAAESEDGEDAGDAGTRTEAAGQATVRRGLHAKVFLQQDGVRTRILVGSANATSPALRTASNVEVLAQLEGPTRKLGGIDDLLGAGGLGEYVEPFLPYEQPKDEAAREAGERRLDDARREISRAGLQLRCQKIRDADDQYELVVEAARPPELVGIGRVLLWPITLGDAHAARTGAFTPGSPVTIGRFSAASLTRFTAFELTDSATGLNLRFVLQLPADGLPEHRHAAVVATVINNREGFLRYLALLLADLEADGIASGLAVAKSQSWLNFSGGDGGAPLLERLVRAFSRDPARLHGIDRLLLELEQSEEGRVSIPEGFSGLWTLFRSALAMESKT